MPAQLLAQAVYASLPIVWAVIRQVPYPIEGIGGAWPWFFLYLAIQYSLWPGALIGLLAGVGCGLGFSAVTLWRSGPLRSPLVFGRVVRILAAVLAVMVAGGVRVLLMQYAHYPWFGAAEFVGALVLPGLAGWWVGSRLAR